MKLVARAIQVCGNHKCKLLAVLLLVDLSVHEHCFLGDAVRSVGLFWVTIPDGLFAKWDWSELWIRTYGAKQNGFLNAYFARCFDDECSHDEIVEIQLRWSNLVVANATDARSQMDDVAWFVLRKQLFGNTNLCEVGFGLARSDNGCASSS